MTVSGHGKLYTIKGQPVSTGVLAALLTALLLLSPTTARAVAQVLTQNGVALPAQVVRVLDALPAESIRETLRRDDEAEAVAVCTPVADPVDMEPVAVVVPLCPLPPCPPLLWKGEGGVPEHWDGVALACCIATCLVPRAPPV